MPNIRAVKKKIRGVKNTQQITRAMKMVATAKLRQAMERLRISRFYTEKLEQIVTDLREHVVDIQSHPLFSARPVKNVGIVLVTGERGLCGSFNYDLIKATRKLISELDEKGKNLLLIGKKGYEHFKKHGHNIIAYHPELTGRFDPEAIHAAARNAVKFYQGEIVDELILVYTDFVTTLERHVITKRLLPLGDIEKTLSKKKQKARPMLFDPDPQTILNALIPHYAEGLFVQAILESAASEQSARMIAMTAATDRADEIIEELTLTYNRTRQAVITKELAEVTGTADAIAG